MPSLDVLALLCAQYVNDERYELAASHFEAAAKMQPSEPKWQLMVASCYNRAGSIERAFEVYEQVSGPLRFHACLLCTPVAACH